MTDSAAFARVETGDTFEQLVRREFGRIRGLAWKFGLREPELDDAVQDIFATAFVAWSSFRGQCQASTWLTRIAVNHLVSRRRALMRRMRLLARWHSRDAAQNRASLRLEVSEEYGRAVACIQGLPPRLRAVFVLRYLEDMSCAQVAEALGIPEATVRTRVFHARKKLREMLQGAV